MNNTRAGLKDERLINETEFVSWSTDRSWTDAHSRRVQITLPASFHLCRSVPLMALDCCKCHGSKF